MGGESRSEDIVEQVTRWTRQLQHLFLMQKPGLKGVWTTARRIRGGLRRLGLLNRGWGSIAHVRLLAGSDAAMTEGRPILLHYEATLHEQQVFLTDHPRV